MKLNKFSILFTVIVFTFAGFSAPALSLERATGDIILEITGNIGNTNTDKKSAVFDRKLLAQFKPVVISTTTPWTDGVVRFEGILIRDLMHSVKAQGTILNATAINEYSIDIPFEDFQKYRVILAYKKNDKIMSLRDQGPFWVIYPWDDNPELKNELYHSRSIWQLKTINVQ